MSRSYRVLIGDADGVEVSGMEYRSGTLMNSQPENGPSSNHATYGVMFICSFLVYLIILSAIDSARSEHKSKESFKAVSIVSILVSILNCVLLWLSHIICK